MKHVPKYSLGSNWQNEYTQHIFIYTMSGDMAIFILRQIGSAILVKIR